MKKTPFFSDARSHWVVLPLFGVAHFLGAILGLWLSRGDASVATLWPSNALLLGALFMVEERRRGHFIFAAFASSLFANLIFDNDVLISLALSFLNSAEATFLYLWFTAVYRGPMRFDRPERVFAYAGMAALVALVSAGLAALVLQPVGEQPMRVARAWFGGDFLAYLVVTPLVLILGAIFRQESFARLERSTQELAVHAIALIAIPFSSSSSPRSRCYSCALPRRCFLSADWGWRALRCRW